MSSYGKVSYMEDETQIMESVSEEVENTSTIDSQVNKFDNTYTTQKLQELYNEYDKITIDEEKIKSVIQVRTNAKVANKASFRAVLAMSTTLIVAILLAVLCIYNITVINGMGSSINYLQEEVVSYQADLAHAESVYNNLTNTENIKDELIQMGYGEMASSNIVAISVPEKVEVEDLQAETNWFDAVCNFVSQIFG